MTKFAVAFALCVAITAPVTVSAQESRRYEDRAHHDTHEWNSNEDQAYHRYLEEHHRKHHDFDKAPRREQNDYWNWRHAHSDDDHRERHEQR